MKTKIRCLLCAMLCVCLGLPTAFAAKITPSVTQISLPKGETKASFDVILAVDKAFAGAEFGLKPSADDVKLESLQMEHVQVESAAKGQSVGFKAEFPVREHDRVFRVTGDS